MPFYVVEFSEGGLAVVPTTWVTPRKTEVFWPPVKDTNTFNKIVRREEEVKEDTWKLYQIQRIFFESDDLESCEKRLKKAEFTSNLDTSDEDIPQSPKRKRKVRTFSSSSEENYSQHKRPPPVKPLQESRTAVSSPKSKVTETPTTSKLIQPSGKKCINIDAKAVSSPKSKVIETPTRIQSTIERKAIEIDAKAYESLLQNIFKIQEQNRKIIDLLENQRSNNNVNGVPVFPVDLPVQDEPNLLLLEEYILNNEDIVKTYLAKIGGENVVIRTNRILKRMITDELATEYSFFGKRQKKQFASLNLFRVLKDAVKQNCSNASDFEVEKSTKIWLKHAPQRAQKALKKLNRI